MTSQSTRLTEQGWLCQLRINDWSMVKESYGVSIASRPLDCPSTLLTKINEVYIRVSYLGKCIHESKLVIVMGEESVKGNPMRSLQVAGTCLLCMWVLQERLLFIRTEAVSSRSPSRAISILLN